MNLPHWTYAGEPGTSEDMKAAGIWIRQSSKLLCPLLARRYPGLRFNHVSITANADHHLIDAPPGHDLDIVSVDFSVSGCRADLARYRFVHPSWCDLIDQGRKSTMAAETEGFGRCYMLQRAKVDWWRVNHGSYVDGIDRVMEYFMPQILAKFDRGSTEAQL